MAELGWIGVLLAVIIAGITLGRWSQRIEHRFEDLARRVEFMERQMTFLISIHRQEFMGFYGGLPDNPTPNPAPPEKKELLRKLEDLTITEEEAARLRQMLEEELKEAEAKGAKMRILAIGGVLMVIDSVVKLGLIAPSQPGLKE